MVTELRHYIAADGKDAQMMEVMQNRVGPILKRLGFNVREYWVDAADPRHHWYTMEWPSAEAIAQGWAKFREDAEWLQVKAAHGAVFGKVESFVLRAVPAMRFG